MLGCREGDWEGCYLWLYKHRCAACAFAVDNQQTPQRQHSEPGQCRVPFFSSCSCLDIAQRNVSCRGALPPKHGMPSSVCARGKGTQVCVPRHPGSKKHAARREHADHMCAISGLQVSTRPGPLQTRELWAPKTHAHASALWLPAASLGTHAATARPLE